MLNGSLSWPETRTDRLAEVRLGTAAAGSELEIYAVLAPEQVHLYDVWPACEYKEPKAVFRPGDTIRWVFSLRNYTGGEVSISLRWMVWGRRCDGSFTRGCEPEEARRPDLQIVPPEPSISASVY